MYFQKSRENYFSQKKCLSINNNLKLLYFMRYILDYYISIMFCRGGKICLTDHFKPLWGRNAPKFGIAHAMALGVSIIVFSIYFHLSNCSCVYSYY